VGAIAVADRTAAGRAAGDGAVSGVIEDCHASGTRGIEERKYSLARHALTVDLDFAEQALVVERLQQGPVVPVAGAGGAIDAVAIDHRIEIVVRVSDNFIAVVTE
jgi:hypothetical protein